MGKDLKDIIEAKKIVEEFLATVGLELSDNKTRIGHSMYYMEGTTGKPGLDFLGFHFRNYPTSKHRGVKNTRGKTNEFIQVSSPSFKSVKNHKQAIRSILRSHRNSPREAVISKLSARIQG
jgi:RNA-directed DNA polymerase